MGVMCKEYTFEEMHRNAERTLRHTDKVIRQTEVAKESDMRNKDHGPEVFERQEALAAVQFQGTHSHAFLLNSGIQFPHL